MRSIRLTPAIAAAAAMLALAPTAASAAKPGLGTEKPVKHCRVVTYAEPRTVTVGEQVQALGQVLCGSPAASAASIPVSIYARSQGQSQYHLVTTLTSGSNGTFSLPPQTITSDVWFYAVALGHRSATSRVRFAPLVTLSGPPVGTPIITGKANAVTFSGTVGPLFPSDAGAEVILQRENSSSFEEWIPIQITTVKAGNVFTIKHTFVVPGDANLRVLVRPHHKYSVRGTSEELSYGISEPQNRALTITSLPDPVPFGQPVTLEGKVAGAAVGTHVTLMSHPRGIQPALSTVASTSTLDASGTYKFTIPAASTNTVYKAVSGAVSSSQLFEGVRYILNANVAPTGTVQALTTLTFSGTVTPFTPARKGKRIYLERENPGGGFHVADVGEVGEGGAFTIVHFVTGVGKQVYRLKVAGDPENQTVSSGPFVEQVTPAPPGFRLLAPKPPTLPSEGKL
jgi:hypothetical protein